ncbi:receptor-like protein 9DC1 [Punica granatum]|uniref:Receptor-like protein 9DC1 n=1 Tax=Punica granatum TaxID=22663 RepID=A0A6P8CD35_PUNGR|nr:receptor-like protein 9DC1 [Punica granatum]
MLELGANNFHGLITLGHAAFPFLYLGTLMIGHNHFHGQLPPEYFQLSNLTYIGLSGNMFDGFLPIPPVTTEVYTAVGNKFTGEIPSSFCNITTLFFINMSNNSLTGKIPQCLINVNTNLAILALEKNRLRGPIPEILARKNCSLNAVTLSQNHLQGKLPRSWASCKQLEVLDLCDNELEDSFPSWLEILPNLHILVLRANNFHGPITSSKFIHPFPVLHILDISNNNFIGTFPSQYIANFNGMMGGDKGQGFLEYHTDVWSVPLFTTMIYKGVQMQWSDIREALVVIDLSHNHFQGEIPEVIGNLQSLIGLNLSHNNFRGSIPTSLGNLTQLEWLDLSSNNCTGEIPATLTNLTFLAIFNVSTNQLTGQIPRGKQFDTFSSDSFEANPNLCGPPLPKPCTESHHQEASSASQDEDDAERWIEWRAVLMGYGCGTVIGLSIGYIFIQTGRAPKWLIKMVAKMQTRTENKPRKTSHGRNHRGNIWLMWVDSASSARNRTKQRSDCSCSSQKVMHASYLHSTYLDI